MNTRLLTFVTAAALSMSSGLALAQDKPAAPAKPAAPKLPQHDMPKGEMPKMPEGMDPMAMMPESMKPGKEHAELAKAVGTWNAEVTMTEGGHEMKSKAVETIKPILGGKFFESEFKGDMMGMPFTGHSLLGYNRVTEKYESIWVDSMGTGMMYSTGTANADGKVITFKGSYDDPMTKEHVNTKQVMTIIDENKHTFEMFTVASDGKESKMMTIVYTRDGAAPKPAGVATPQIKAPEVKIPGQGSK